MDEQQRQLLNKYIDLLLRKKKLIIFCLLISILGGLGVYLKTPKIYKTTALIMYQRQRINPAPISPDPTLRARQLQETINTVSQQVTSRTSLENIISQYDLYPNLRQHLPMEDVVATMRQNIEIQSNRREGDIFKVSFSGRAPKTVMLVTNAIAAKYIEENLRFREELASEVSSYTEDELKMAKEQLDKKEEIMRDYKLKYYNEMPQQLQINMNRLNALQEQYQNNQNNIQNLDQTKILIQEQISLRKNLFDRQNMPSDEGSAALQTDTQVLTGNTQEDIARVHLELESLQAKYTDQHPEVKRAKKLLQKLETTQAQQSIPADAESDQGAASASQTLLLDPQLEQLVNQLKESELQVKVLTQEGKEIREQIKRYQKWVEITPIREAEWSALTRDYNQLQQHYEELVTRNLEAKSAETLERRQKGSQFKIIDPAHFPENPFKPDFRKIILIAAVLGIGLGGGIAFALEIMDSSLKDANEIEPYLEIPLVCSIPIIYTEEESKRKRIKTIAWAISYSAAIFSVSALILYLWRKGSIII